MTPLCDLAEQHGSDKCPALKHHYTPFYHALFSERREAVRKVIEIGIGTGASLRMWRDYFPQARVWGMDHDPRAMIYDEPRISTLLGDQRSQDDLLMLLTFTAPDVDLVIDDGSHNPEDQVYTCLALMPWLRPGVVYCIEDVGKPEIMEQLRMYQVKTARIKHKASWNDRIVVVRHE